MNILYTVLQSLAICSFACLCVIDFLRGHYNVCGMNVSLVFLYMFIYWKPIK